MRAGLLSVLGSLALVQASEHKFLSYQNVSISCFEYGDASDPTIILTGGWPWPSDRYDGMATQLASDGFHVVRYDQRGAGESGHPTEEGMYSLPNLANEFGTVIDSFAPQKPITVYGETWGPFIASEYACTYPGRVKSIVSVGTPSFDLAISSLKKATLEVVIKPFSLFDVAKQWAALSYFFFLDLPILPEWFYSSDLPSYIINNITLSLEYPGQQFNSSVVANYPTHKADYLPGSNKYKWLVNNRILHDAKWSYLPVDNVRNFQLTSDPIETYLLDIDLNEHTPNLNLTILNGTHLVFDSGGNYEILYDTITDYAERAQQ